MNMTVARRRKILVLPPIHWPVQPSDNTGEGPNVWRLFDALGEHGIDVTVLNPGQAPWNPFAGRGTFLQALDPWRALDVLLRKRRYDAVVTVFQAGAVPLLLLRNISFFFKPIVLWDMNLVPDWRLGQWSMALAAKRSDLLLTLTKVQADYIESAFNPASRPMTIGHYVDEQFYATGLEDKKPGSYVFTIGDDEGRDYETLFEVHASREKPLPLIARTSQVIANETHGIEIIKERQSFIKLRELYAGARYVVVTLKPTLNPSGVSAVLEAASMGKAIIVSDTPSIRPFVRANETALLVPPGDRDSLKAAMELLESDEALARRLGDQARKLVEEEFSVKSFSHRFANALQTVTAS